MGEPGKTKIFWVDKFEGRPSSAYPFRCNLKEAIEQVESTTNEKVVAIIYDETYTIELLTAKKENERE